VGVVRVPPPPLKPGDLLRVVSPSGALRELNAFQLGVEIWRSRGYQVELSTGIEHRWGIWLEQMPIAATSCSVPGNPECRGILCARGGYGSARILEDWTWPQLETSKWLIGFSDITLLWSLSKVGISGVHGPLTTLAAEPDWSIQRLFDWVEGRSLPSLKGTGWGGIAPRYPPPANHRCHPSTRHLSQPQLDGVILALEDVTEAPSTDC